MIPVVYNLEDAMKFFLENSSGSVMCVDGEAREQECFSYPEAKKFYEGEKRE
jgi:hypothetical protein